MIKISTFLKETVTMYIEFIYIVTVYEKKSKNILLR